MQIQSVLLYSHSGQINEIPFDLGKVNVLTGPSGRGKSALLSVIDYCLGSSRFEIPAGVISNTVAWFALKLVIGSERLFVARKGVPVGRTASSEFFIYPNPDDVTPSFDELRSNARKDDLVDKVDALLGVGATYLARADGSTERRKLTFRSGLIYSFQKQNEIANPDLYFHRQSELGQIVRETLPYYLGAISPSVIEKQAELREKRKRLRDVERALSRTASVAANRDRELNAIVAESARLGLVSAADTAALGSVQFTLDHVKSAVRDRLLPEAAASAEGEDILVRLNADLLEKSRERADEKKSIDALERFEADQHAVNDALNEQRRRLKALYLLSDSHDAADCPVCQSPLEHVTPTVAAMRRSLTSLDSELSLVSGDRRDVREHLATRRANVIRLNSEITEIRETVARIKEEQEAVKSLLEQRNEISRLSGMVDMFARLIQVGDDEQLTALKLEREALLTAIEELDAETNLTDVRSKTSTFLGAIGQQITQWARAQALEYANGFLTFDLRGPRLVSETTEETIPFSRFGSGRNWVWYHLLGHLALHHWYIANNRPTPRFIVLDQPSQVYFPAADGSRGEQDMGEVRRIYKWLFETARAQNGGLQIIVTDHAKFDDDPEFVSHMRHDWWKGGSLVPDTWAIG